MATALHTLLSLPVVPFVPTATPLHELTRLRSALGASCPRLVAKRDDVMTFAMGGNKVRKMQTVAAAARAANADVLITCGGVQSNHARVTAAAGAVLGMSVVLVANGAEPAVPTGNAKLNRLFGAEIVYVASRADRAPAMEAAASRMRSLGRRPFIVPLGASTALGAMGIARAVEELASSPYRPDAIVHATSSAGTQAGLIVGCALFGISADIIGISADDPADALERAIGALVSDAAHLLGAQGPTVGSGRPILVDDSFVGEGYGLPTPQSREAAELFARTEGIVLDQTYTAKAAAGLISRIRAGAWDATQTVLFWHTGGVPGFFA